MSQLVNILFAGVEPELEQRVRSVLEGSIFTVVRTGEEFFETVDTLSPQCVHLMCCGPAYKDLPAIELAQSLKYQVPGRPLLYMSSEKYSADVQILIKNGFDQTFLLPFDGARLDKSLRKIHAAASGEEVRQLVSVPLDGLKVGSVVDFDVMIFLPLNQKYVRLFKKGSVVRPEIIAKFSKQGLMVVFVNDSDEGRYKEYVAQHAPEKSETLLSRRDRLQSSMISMFHTLISPDQGRFEDGRQLLDKANGVLNELISTAKVSNVIEDLFRHTGQVQGDHYDQSLRVSSYAALFGMILGRGKPEDLALAGLFHHVGLARCPENLLQKSWSEMTPAERETYARHPEDSVKMLQEKKLVVVPEVQAAILGHHERPDASGYPRKLNEAKISEEAAILAYSCAFDDLTVLKTGKARVTPPEAAQVLLSSGLCPNEMLQKLSKALKAA